MTDPLASRPAPGRIRTVEVPAGWESIADLCTQVHDDIDAVARRCAADIRSSISAYDHTRVSEADLHSSVVGNMELLLVAIAEHREPRPEEIAALRSLGRERALQGMGVSAVNEAFHIGYRHVWTSLVERASSATDATRSSLLDAATTMWAWTHHTGDALGSSHAAVVHDMAVRDAATRYRFLELLASDAPESEELVLLATSLGFSVAGTFRASVYEGGEPGTDDAHDLQQALGDVAGVHQVVARGSVISVISQDGTAAEVAGIVRAAFPTVTGGIGCDRAGLAGARLSMGDAARAAGVAEPGTTATFDDEWLWAVLADDADRLSGVLHHAAVVARDHDGLAETVRAYAESGFSPSRTAEALFVHANTVAYRLRRWHELTGWDPRTFDGLLQSMACIRLSSSTPPPEPLA